MRSRFRLAGEEHAVSLSRSRTGYRLHGDGWEGGLDVALADHHPPEGEVAGAGGPTERGRPHLDRRRLTFGGHCQAVVVVLDGDDVHVHLDGRSYVLTYLDPVLSHAGDAAGSREDEARAPMPGTVVAVRVAPGDAVAAGDGLVVIESMKLETTIRAPRAGTVAAVHVREGQGFDRDAVLVTLADAV